MKIALMARNSSLDCGGLGRYGWELSRRLQQWASNAPHSSVILRETPGEDLVSYFKYTFVDLAVSRPQADVYHALTPMESMYLPKHRSVVTIHDLITLVHPELHGARMAGSALKTRVGRACFSYAATQAVKCRFVVFTNQESAEEAADVLNADPTKFRIIPLGISEALRGPAPQHTPNPRPVIGYLGQLDQRKRVDLLIRAITYSYADCDVHIGGTGLYESELKAIAADDPRIHFDGYIPEDNIVDFYSHCDIFVFPTAVEGYGLPPVEAMACNVPVVMLRDAIVPATVKNRCATVDSLSDLIHGTEVSIPEVDLSSNRTFALTHNWDDSVCLLLSLYQEIAEG